MQTFLLLALLIASAVAGPLSSRSDNCARHCTDSNKFNYETGKAYKYDYASDTTTAMMGAVEEESRLHIKASVLITVHSKCELSMKLQDVVLEESDPKYANSREASKNSESFRKDLEEHTLRYSFQDGRIEEICPADKDPWILNIKRGIMSTFQNTMEDLQKSEDVQEMDVAGNCPVAYQSLDNSWGVIKVKKTKDYGKCTDRQSARTSLQALAYDHNSDVKSNPLIKGEQKCVQSFSYRRIKKVECTETLLFRPFSNDKSGAVTKSMQTLTFNGETRPVLAGDDSGTTRSTLIFDHKFGGDDVQRYTRVAEKTLQELCAKSSDDIKKDVPHVYARFVFQLKRLEYPSLESIRSRTKDICKFNQKGLKYFQDALPTVGTAGAVKMMVKLIREKIVSENEADLWFTSLAFIPKPTLEILTEVVPALDRPTKQAILGISSLVNAYCLTDKECEHQANVKKILSKFENMLNRNCKAKNESERRLILLALKAIANAGHSKWIVDTVNYCIKNDRLDVETTLAAVKSFRRQSCSIPRTHLMELYKDLQEDVEVRIAAYLEVMRCPNAPVVHNVKNVLENEDVNQVGSFVWTHLTNMQETTDPCKQDVKELLSDSYLAKKFSTDARKFSRAFEGSVYSEKVNTGMHVDGNVIFTPESYIPRSAMFNLTMDLFGHSLNVFEVGGRVEGFEHLVESFFGPNGYFPDKTVSKFLKSSRRTRSVYDNRIDEFQKLYNAWGNNRDDPSGSMYLNMFGNEILYGSFKGLESAIKSSASEVNWIDVIADLAKNKDLEYTKSVMFLDAAYTIPTGSGLPLSLAVNGTSTMNLKLGGKFDVRNIFRKEIGIDGHIKPSAAVEISALMSVDAFYAHTGLKMVATLHSSTSLDGKIEMRNGKILTTSLNLPKDKIEILDVQTNIYLIHKDVERSQMGVHEDRTEVHSCTGIKMAKITGFKLCGDVQYPNASLKYESPYFPLTGPTKFAIYLEKTDRKMTSYQFDATFDMTETKKAAMLSFKTPNSEIDRELTVDMIVDKTDKTAAFRVRTPMKKMGISGKFDNEQHIKKFDFSLTIDDLEKFGALAELKIEEGKQQKKYVPQVEIRIPGMKSAKLNGYALIQRKKMSADVQIENLTKKMIELRGDITTQSKGRHDVDIRISSYFLTSKIRGNVQTRERVTTTNMRVDYSMLEGKTETLKIGSKYQDMSASTLTKLNARINVDVSAAPDYNTDVNWEMQLANGHVENTLRIKQGIKKKKNQIDVMLQEIVSFKFSPRKNTFFSTFKFKIPAKKIYYVLYAKHQNTPSFLKSRVFVQYVAKKRVDLQLEARKYDKKVTGDVKLNYPGRQMLVDVTASKAGDGEYEARVTGQLNVGNRVTAFAKYGDKSTASYLHHTAEVEVTLPGSKIVTYNGHVKSSREVHSISNKLDYDKDVYVLNGELRPVAKKVTAVVIINGTNYALDGSIDESETMKKATIDLTLDTYRKIHGMASFDNKPSNRLGKFNLQWDADRDEGQKVEFVVDYKPEDHSTYVRLYYPERTLQAKFNTKGRDLYHGLSRQANGEFSWDKDQKVSLNFNVVSKNYGNQVQVTVTCRSPFEDYRYLALKQSHQMSEESVQAKVSVTKERDYVALDFNGSYRDEHSTYLFGDLQLTSNVRSYERLGLKIEHKSANKYFVSNVTTYVGKDEEIKLSIDGTDQSDDYTSKYDGKFTLNTPYEDYEQVTGGLSHSLARSQLTTTSHLQWGRNKRITLNVGGTETTRGKKRTCNSSVRITTPYDGYETIQAVTSYVNDGKSMNVDNELNWSNKKITFGFDASKEDRRDRVQGSIYLTSPYENFEDLKLSASHYAIEKRLHDDLELRSGSDVLFGVKTNGHWKSLKDISSDVELTTPVTGYRNVKVVFSHNGDASGFTENLNVGVETETKFDATLKGRLDSLHDFQAEVVISTAVKSYESLKGEVTHLLSEKALKSHVEWSVNTEKTTIDLNGQYTETRNSRNVRGSLIASSPITDYEAMSVTFSHELRADKMNNLIEMKRGDEDFSLVQELSITDILNFNHKIDVVHSWREYLPQISISNVQSSTTGSFFHDSKMTLNNDKFASISTSYQNKQKKLGNEVEAMVKYETEEGIIFYVGGKHEDDTKNFKPKITVRWNRNSKDEKMELATVVNFESAKKIYGRLTLSSTMEDYESSMLEGEYNLENHKKTAQITFICPKNHQYRLTGKVDTYKKSAIVKFFSPIENLRRLTFAGSYSVDTNMKGDVSFQWSSTKRVELSGSVVNEDDKKAVAVTFSSPFEKYEKLIFAADSDTSKERKTGEVSFEFGPDKKIKASGNFLSNDRHSNAKLTFVSPFEGYELIEAETKYDPSANQKRAGVTLKWPKGKKIAVSAEITHREDQGSAKLTLDTPIYPTMTLHGDYDATKSPMTGNVRFTWDEYKRMELNGNFHRENSRLIKGSLKFTSPFENLESIDFTTNLEKDDDSSYKGDLRFSWDQENKVSSEVNVQFEPLDVTVKFDTPYDPVKDVVFKAKLRDGKVLDLISTLEWKRYNKIYLKFLSEIAGNNELQTTFTVTTPFEDFQKLAIRSTYLVKDDVLTAGLEAETSFESMPSLQISTTIKSKKQRDYLEFKVKADEVLFHTKFVWKRTNQETANLYLNIPKVFKNPIKIDGTYEDEMGTLNLNTGYNTYTIKAQLMAKVNKGSLEVRIPTLKPRYQVMKIEGTVDVNEDDAKILLGANDAYDSHKVKVSYGKGKDLVEGEASLETSVSSLGKISVTGELQYGEKKEASVKFETEKSKYFVTGVLENLQDNKLDGYVTVKTPFKLIESARIDVNYENMNWEKVDGTIKVETSNEDFRSATIQAKFEQTRRQIRSSLIVKTPLSEYHTMSVIANVGHNTEWTEVKPSITFSIPENKLNIYGQYDDGYAQRTIVAGFSRNRDRPHEMTIKVDKNEFAVKVTLKRPTEQETLTYQTEVKYNENGGRHHVEGYLLLPKNRITVNGDYFFRSWKVFDARLLTTSTYRGWESVSAAINNRYDRAGSQSMMTFSWSPTETFKLSANTKNEYSSYTGKVQMQTPWEMVRGMNMDYKYGDDKLETGMEYQGKTVYKFVGSTSKNKNTIWLNVPKLSMSTSGSLNTGDETEATFKLTIPSRVVYFRTIKTSRSSGFKSSTEFAWNQRENGKASVDVIYDDRSKRGSNAGELTVSVVHPIKSMEVKFIHQLSERDVVLSTNFKWDPLRNTRKQISVNFQGHDVSVYGKDSYKGQIAVKTPSMNNELKVGGSIALSGTHREVIKANIKLDYNGDRRRAMEYEIKLTDETRGRRTRRGISYTLLTRLRHPASATDINFYSTIVSKEQYKKVDTRLQYVDSSSKRKSYMFRVNANKKLNIQINSPQKAIRLIGTTGSDSAELTMTENKKRTMLARYTYSDDQEMSGKAELIYFPTNDGVTIRAVKGRSITVDVNHKNNGKDFSDFLFTLGLKKSRILSSQMIWRTSILSEIENEVRSIYEDQVSAFEKMKDEMSENLRTEFKNKMANIKRTNLIELKPLLKDLDKMNDDLYRDYRVMKDQASKMFDRDEFYLKTSYKMAVKASSYVSSKYDGAKKVASQFAEDVAETLTLTLEFARITVAYVCEISCMIFDETMDFIAYSWRTVADGLMEVSMYVLNTICRVKDDVMSKIANFADDLMEYLRNYTYDLYQRLVNVLCKNFYVCDVAYFVQGTAKDLMDAFYGSRFYKLMDTCYGAISNLIDDIREIEFMEIFGGHLENVSTKLKDSYASVSDSFSEQYKNVMEHPHVAFSVEIANHGYQKIAWAYRFWGVDESLNDLYQNWYKYLMTVITDVAHDSTVKYANFLKDSKAVFEPLMGRIMIDIRLPSKRDSLADLLDIGSSPEYKHLLKIKDKYMPTSRFSLWDYWYMYRPHSDFYDWVPPFKTQAMMVGKQHFVTFDKLFYDFAGKCSYLLAHDFIDGNFSVIVNYAGKEDAVKKSIVVTSSGKNVEITPSFKVTVDGVKVELPQQFGDTEITRFGDTVTIDNDQGVVVRCNFHRDVCTVDMSGWYFGKTAGLFGVYDHEPRLDMTKPNGDVSKHVTDFATSWSVGSGHCKPENLATRTRSSDYEAEEICKTIFEDDDSPLRPCFQMVDTRKYVEMCSNDVSNRDRYIRVDDGICTAAYAYQQRCLAEEIEVRMPTSCSRCKKADGSIMEQGDFVTVTKKNKPSVADVVFIVEEKKCIKDKVNMMDDMTIGIERSMKDKGIVKTTYTVVGYGGDGVHEEPHVHYSNSQQSGTYRSIASAFGTLTQGNGRSDVYEAIRFATNLRFTPGAAKTFILIKCSPCESSEIKENYGDALRMLVEQEISLHVLMENDFRLRSKSSKKSSIFGLDKDYAYTVKDVRDEVLEGDKDLRAQIYDTKDYCVPLAFETNGTLFDMRKLAERKRNVRKNFVHVFTRRVAETTEASDCQVCDCLSDAEGTGKIQCVRCISPFHTGLFSPNLPEFTSWPETMSRSVSDERNR